MLSCVTMKIFQTSLTISYMEIVLKILREIALKIAFRFLAIPIAVVDLISWPIIQTFLEFNPLIFHGKLHILYLEIWGRPSSELVVKHSYTHQNMKELIMMMIWSARVQITFEIDSFSWMRLPSMPIDIFQISQYKDNFWKSANSINQFVNLY